VQFKSPSPKPKPAVEITTITESTKPSVPKTVDSGIEALAAVLPAGRKSAPVDHTTNQESISTTSPPGVFY
jgi:hypothetical protein